MQSFIEGTHLNYALSGNPVEKMSDGLLFDIAPRYCIWVYGGAEKDKVTA